MEPSFSLSVFICVHSWLPEVFLPHKHSAFRSRSFYSQVITGSRAEGIAAQAIGVLVPVIFVE
jgi:hypothetical protein